MLRHPHDPGLQISAHDVQVLDHPDDDIQLAGSQRSEFVSDAVPPLGTAGECQERSTPSSIDTRLQRGQVIENAIPGQFRGKPRQTYAALVHEFDVFPEHL